MAESNDASANGGGADAGPSVRPMDAQLGVPADGVPSTEPASLQASAPPPEHKGVQIQEPASPDGRGE